MSDADCLFTVAQVSVALTGFAGLVSVVADRLGDRSGEVGADRLRTMLLYSLTATFFCLVPYICIRSGLAEIRAWRRCSAGLFIAWLVIFGRAFPRARRFSRGTLSYNFSLRTLAWPSPRRASSSWPPTR